MGKNKTYIHVLCETTYLAFENSMFLALDDVGNADRFANIVFAMEGFSALLWFVETCGYCAHETQAQCIGLSRVQGAL